MKKRGKGIAASFYGTGYGNGFPDVSVATVGLEDDGRISISVGASEVGQGAKTILCQIGGEVLNLNMHDLIFVNDDSRKTPDSGTAAASRQTYNTGNAVKISMESFKEKLFEIAKDELKLNSSIGLHIKDKSVYLKIFPEKKISFEKIAQNLKKKGMKLVVTESFTAQTTVMDTQSGQGAPYWPYTFNCYGVEVEVDTETGKVNIIKALCAQDVGKAINPSMVEGQIDGGFVMGVGYALFEDLGLENGRIKNNKFSRYIIPTSLDIPEIEKVIIQEPESTGPYGAKGIGEPVMIPVAPAILNGIYDAVGVRIKELPATPEKILRALRHIQKIN
ncbi:MAG: molybdopterin-dependent oxidoreductase [Anaeromicrobium sp.]|jgi:CO/xanthine dehydrogenase Mo-binding subunit|uniref:xanthine dehydrogenase family protein molybdopterin-binding subunit n=1 Tax=Anaeromicrobium sp. TaxID=1929132 RepID=UPI0025CDF796|nr:molybdopterin cofactor-binding domain-containing protein [Anaeromicrobium sp.]MCT4593541.1 molybdopterin-dependent oxidoreductase [Anaeromicrobium sp.]